MTRASVRSRANSGRGRTFRVMCRNHSRAAELISALGTGGQPEKNQKGSFMIKKMMASAAVAASIVGVSAAVAPSAMAIGNDQGTTTLNGNGAVQSYGNSATHGDWSPQFALIQGSLN